MNNIDFLLFFAGMAFGTLIPGIVSGFKALVQARSANKRLELSLMRLDAELKGIKSIIGDNKNIDAKLLNEALEKDFGSPDQVK